MSQHRWAVFPWLLLGITALPSSLAAQVASIQAFAGSPWGIAEVTIRLTRQEARWFVAGLGQSLESHDGRALYPVFTRGRLRQWLADEDDLPGSIDVLFLIRGTAPVDLVIHTPAAHRVRVVPGLVSTRQDARQF